MTTTIDTTTRPPAAPAARPVDRVKLRGVPAMLLSRGPSAWLAGRPTDDQTDTTPTDTTPTDTATAGAAPAVDVDVVEPVAAQESDRSTDAPSVDVAGSRADRRPVADVDERRGGGRGEDQVDEAPASSTPPASAPAVKSTAEPRAVPKALSRLYNTFYGVIGALALWGQTAGLARIIYGDDAPKPEGWHEYLAFYALPALFAAVIELLAAILQRWADWRRIECGEKALVAYVFAVLAALGVAGLNWYGHHGGITGALFCGASAAAFGMFSLRSYARRRDTLIARGELLDMPPGTPGDVAERARDLARRKPGKNVWQYVHDARLELAKENQRKAIRDALEAQFTTEGGHDARLALAVYDLDAIAEELANSVDYGEVAHRLSDRLTATGRRVTDRPTNTAPFRSTNRPTGNRPDAATGRPTGNRDRSTGTPTGEATGTDRPATAAGHPTPTGETHHRSTGSATRRTPHRSSTGRPNPADTNARLEAAYARLVDAGNPNPSGTQLGEAAGVSKTVANDWKKNRGTNAATSN